MTKAIIIIILVLLIIAVIYDFLRSRTRNKEEFGSDFLLDSINTNRSKTNSNCIPTSETLSHKEKLRIAAEKMMEIKNNNRQYKNDRRR